MSNDPNLPPEEPLGATPPPIDAPSTVTGATEGTGIPRNIAAVLACIFLLIGGIVFYLLDRRDRFVRFYALQSIVGSLSFFVISFAFSVCLFIVGRIPVVGWLFAKAYLLTWLGFGALWIVLIVNAYQGKYFELPYLWKIAKRYIPQSFL